MAASGGIGEPSLLAASIHRRIFLFARHTIPQTLSSRNNPIPPPTPIESDRLLSQPCEFKCRKNQLAAIMTAVDPL